MNDTGPAAGTAIVVHDVTKVYDLGEVKVEALRGVSFTIERGEYVAIMGPSGSGKSTLMNVLGCLDRPTAGRYLLDGTDVSTLADDALAHIRLKKLGFVFQGFNLLARTSALKNVALPLFYAGIATKRRNELAAARLTEVGLADRLDHKPNELSGGQQQRVAIARALAIRPRVLLLDEPLSALDAHLREQMQVELKRLQARLGMTFIMVTHDQTEALSISDRIAVMNMGRIEQIAPPATLYDRPATRFVARFIGTMNLFEARCIAREGTTLRFVAGGLPLDLALEAQRPAPAEGEIRTIGVRPEDLIATPEASPATTPARIASIVFHGRSLRIHADLLSGAAIVVDRPRQSSGVVFAAGDLAHLQLRAGASCVLLDA
ncbi:MAG TPA: ABC transporter ATP-binding protein [Candidatus Elarobacter sp.]